MIVKGTEPAAVKEIIATKPVVIVDIFTTWCPPCKELAKELAVIARKCKQVTIVKVNFDDVTGTKETLDAWTEHLPFCKDVADLGYVPIMVFFKDGKQVDAFLGDDEPRKGIISGYIPAAAIEGILKRGRDDPGAPAERAVDMERALVSKIQALQALARQDGARAVHEITSLKAEIDELENQIVATSGMERLLTVLRQSGLVFEKKEDSRICPNCGRVLHVRNMSLVAVDDDAYYYCEDCIDKGLDGEISIPDGDPCLIVSCLCGYHVGECPHKCDDHVLNPDDDVIDWEYELEESGSAREQFTPE